jgi:hypothetical protein
MFGYWAGVWVHLNRLGDPIPNPFKDAVKLARKRREAMTQCEHLLKDLPHG